ncbi:MAG: tRNA lysidine(34) synthetase TilS [Paracoccaceae bacterium]
MSLDQQFADAMGQLLGPNFPDQLGLAVSGGGDSMAMLALAQSWARVWGVGLRVVTVDHGLRPESAGEAQMVAQECAILNIPHDIVRWQWDGLGNVQDAARNARLSLIDSWRGGIEHVLMAHTRDDVAETFLIRLARGSGVDGLSKMQAKRHIPTTKGAGFHIIRPCLDMRRTNLRSYASACHVPWVDDPSNEDPKYTRVQMRKALPLLEDLGISADVLVDTAGRMARASEALKARAYETARSLCAPCDQGLISFARDGFAKLEPDTQTRLLGAACMWVSGAHYKPRAAAVVDLCAALLAGGAGTLIGAKAETTHNKILVFREYGAVGAICSEDRIWDGRWTVSGPWQAGYQLRALGEGIAHCTDWRTAQQPRAAVMASPAVWCAEDLIAAPIAHFNPDWHAQIVTPFTSYLLSH